MAEVRKYLDQVGVDAFWSKVKTLTTNKVEEVNARVQELHDKVTAMGAVFSFKGVKATVADLPAENQTVGEVWHVTEDGGEYVWDGTKWELLGSNIDLTAYLTKEDAAKLYAAKSEVEAAATAAANAQKAAETADTKATNAQTAATEAKTAAATADTKAGNAQTTATEAKTAAAAADTKATEASTAAGNAQKTAEEAKALAGTALQPADIEAIPTSYIEGLA